MAKTTAKSKGFRKQEKKKPFLTKKELIALIIIIVVAVAAFLVINWYPNRMFLKESAVKPGDITSYANSNGTRVKNFFVKLGEIKELEGYTMEVTSGGGANQNYSFYPVEESNIDHVEIRGAYGSAEQQIEYIYAAETEAMPFYDMAETTFNGLPAYAYAYSTSAYEAPEGEEATGTEEHNSFSQNVSAYVAYNDTHSIAIHVYLKGDNEGIFVAEEDMVDFLAPFAEAFTVYTKQ